MEQEDIVDVDATEEEITELIESTTIEASGMQPPLSALVQDLQTAHEELDEYKSGSLSLAQSLSEEAKETNDEVLEAVLTDMSDAAFGVYLRLHRGDMELFGKRDGEYSGFLTE